MFSNKFIQAALAAMFVSTLAACGGETGTTAGGGTTDVTSSGAITGFGSVFVNGVRFETENARIVSEDDGSVIKENPTDAELKEILGLGEVITVRGTRTDDSNGVAGTIRVDDELVGEITSVSAADGSIVVLAQIVSVTPDTIIDDSIIEAVRGVEIPNDLRFGDLPETLDQLFSAGMFVEVNGFPSQNGLEATRIEDVSDLAGAGGAGLDDEVKGFVKQLVQGTSFKINGLTVFYDQSDLDSEDFSNVALAEGQYVEVHGDAIPPDTLDANRIELEDDLVEDDFDEVEGMISDVRPDDQGSGGVIVINGMELRVNDVSLFSEGLRVEIKGFLQGDGSIVLTGLEDESEDTVRTEDLVVSSDGSSFTTRLGLSIAPSDRSRLEDDTLNDDDNLSIEQFLGNVDGKRIEARGFPLDGNMVWTRLEIEDSNDQDCRLRGPAANITGDAADFSFEIQGVAIDVSTVSENNFEGANDQPIGKAQFFSRLASGVIVQATSDNAGIGCTNLNLVAREVELEPADDVLMGDDGNGVINNDNEDALQSFFGSRLVQIHQLASLQPRFSPRWTTLCRGLPRPAGIHQSAPADRRQPAGFSTGHRGTEVANDLPFGDLAESLQALLPSGLNVVVGVDRSSGVVAIYIEDI